MGRELQNNICQFCNFKEVVKNLNNSKGVERKLWDVALSKKEPPTPSTVLTLRLLLEKPTAVGVGTD